MLLFNFVRAREVDFCVLFHDPKWETSQRPLGRSTMDQNPMVGGLPIDLHINICHTVHPPASQFVNVNDVIYIYMFC